LSQASDLNPCFQQFSKTRSFRGPKNATPGNDNASCSGERLCPAKSYKSKRPALARARPGVCACGNASGNAVSNYRRLWSSHLLRSSPGECWIDSGYQGHPHARRLRRCENHFRAGSPDRHHQFGRLSYAGGRRSASIVESGFCFDGKRIVTSRK
jgi:hypothetical protein